ncbi:MAG: hypothetical protein QXJ14_03475 [Candidatus Aenigmatarchaeota archaeon]
MNIKQEILNKLPKRYRLEIILDNLDKTKLYSKKFFINQIKANDSYVRALKDCFFSKNYERIVIDRKTYWGDKKLVKKIKEMLIE